VPVFQDGRLELARGWLREEEGLKRVAIFYDAICWSMPEVGAADVSPRFLEYLCALARFDLVVCISSES
jgi:hypothetical protein